MQVSCLRSDRKQSAIASAVRDKRTPAAIWPASRRVTMRLHTRQSGWKDGRPVQVEGKACLGRVHGVRSLRPGFVRHRPSSGPVSMQLAASGSCPTHSFQLLQAATIRKGDTKAMKIRTTAQLRFEFRIWRRATAWGVSSPRLPLPRFVPHSRKQVPWPRRSRPMHTRRPASFPRRRRRAPRRH